MTEHHTVAPLSKVCLTLEAGTSPKRMELTPKPIPLDFIVGVAPDGLAGLEMAILDKRVPDEIVLEIKPTEIEEFFGHLPSPGLIFFHPAGCILCYAQTDRRGAGRQPRGHPLHGRRDAMRLFLRL
jgi:hypothetical protein